MLYQILPERRIPQVFLIYKSEKVLASGQLVKIPLRNKPLLGIIIKEIKEVQFSVDKIKDVSEVLPLCFPKKLIKFITIFATNTFNQPNLVFQNFCRHLKLLTKKNWQELESSFQSTQNKQNLSEPETTKKSLRIPKNKDFNTDYHLDSDITLRIIYLIRNYIKKLENRLNHDKSKVKVYTNQQVLILFPERKHLLKIFEEITTNKDWQSILKSNQLNIKLETFLSDYSKESKATYRNLILNSRKSQTQELQIILATRSAIFLPYPNLQKIILVDEANTMHIQDQNSVYFDTREAVFILSRVFDIDLDFVSTLPSVRLYKNYSKEVLDKFVSNDSKNIEKPLKIQVTERQKKFDQFELFSDAVQEIIDPS